MKRPNRPVWIVVLVLMSAAGPAAAQLSLQWMVPAAAHTAGHNGTFWRTDLSLHNPQVFELPVMLQFLPSASDNGQAQTLYLTLGPWQTVNLWDVLGPSGFAVAGTGAIVVVADWSLSCQPVEDCEFLVTSRTYTLDPAGGVGEYGQTIPGASTWQGVDWGSLGYAAGILNDGVRFRTNVGVASWGDGWTRVAVDVQDADGLIIDRLSFDLPPYGHLQRRLPAVVEGGSLVFWLEDGPDDPLVFGYASVVDELTGDSSFQLAQPSEVGFAADKGIGAARSRRSIPEPAAGSGSREIERRHR